MDMVMEGTCRRWRVVPPQPGFCRELRKEPNVEGGSCEKLLGLATALPSKHLRLIRHCSRHGMTGDFLLWPLPPLASLLTSESYCYTVAPHWASRIYDQDRCWILLSWALCAHLSMETHCDRCLLTEHRDAVLGTSGKLLYRFHCIHHSTGCHKGPEAVSPE